MNDTERTINHLTMLRRLDSGEKKKLYDVAISALENQLTTEPTAIEFLRKAKAICDTGINCDVCPLVNSCMRAPMYMTDESDLVRKVMDYRLEVSNETT